MKDIEFLHKLESLVGKTKPEKGTGKDIEILKRIFNTELKIHGLITPTQRKLSTKFYKEIKKEIKEEVFIKYTLYCFQQSQVFEAKSILLFILEKEFSLDSLNKYSNNFLKISSYIENWCHSDIYSKMLSFLHEEYPSKMYTIFQKWNKSEDVWLIRLSLTSLIHYSFIRKKRIISQKDFWPLVLPFINHDFHYIQKAVGWQLREFGNVYEQDLIDFLNNNCESLASTVFSYATEKLKHLPEKEEWKARRKANRSLQSGKK